MIATWRESRDMREIKRSLGWERAQEWFEMERGDRVFVPSHDIHNAVIIKGDDGKIIASEYSARCTRCGARRDVSFVVSRDSDETAETWTFLCDSCMRDEEG